MNFGVELRCWGELKECWLRWAILLAIFSCLSHGEKVNLDLWSDAQDFAEKYRTHIIGGDFDGLGWERVASECVAGYMAGAELVPLDIYLQSAPNRQYLYGGRPVANGVPRRFLVIRDGFGGAEMMIYSLPSSETVSRQF